MRKYFHLPGCHIMCSNNKGIKNIITSLNRICGALHRTFKHKTEKEKKTFIKKLLSQYVCMDVKLVTKRIKLQTADT